MLKKTLSSIDALSRANSMLNRTQCILVKIVPRKVVC